MSRPAGRGGTTVSEHALVKIAEQVAAEDGRLADRPHASASVSGSTAAVHLDVALRYPPPQPVPHLAAELRDRLRRRLRELTGLSAENIDIEITRLGETAAADRPGRRARAPERHDQREERAASPAEVSGRRGMFVPLRPPGERSARRAFRPARAVPATVAAVALLVVGLSTAVQVGSALLGRPVRLVPYDQVLRWARTTTWDDGGALAVAGALAVLGALLVLLAAVPGRGHRLALRTADPDLVVALPRHALARRLRHAVGAVDGVRRAGVRVSGRRVTVRAWTDLRDTSAVTGRVHTAVDQELSRLSPVHRMPVRVQVRGPS